jgi:hypothetical protein
MGNKTPPIVAALWAIVVLVPAPSLAADSYGDWLAKVQALPPQTSDSGPDTQAVALLNAINSKVSSTDAIQALRNWPEDDALVKALIPYAGGSFSETRIPATRILGNVVDNTNICMVLAYLNDKTQGTADGRYNLLQVVRQVSYYAWSDTGEWIARFVERNLPAARADSNLQKTAATLEEVQTILVKRAVGTEDRLRDLALGKYNGCLKLLDVEPVDVVTPEPLETPPLVADDLDATAIRDGLFSADRRLFAEAIVARYTAATPAQQRALVQSLLEAIVLDQDDGQRRYRINLYIALTFSLLPQGAAVGADLDRLAELRSAAEMKDPTFRQNVENAIRRQGGS